MKEFLLVSVGSFFGGGLRYLVSKAVQGWAAASFPFGTLAVNVIGCLLLGFLSGLAVREGSLWNPHVRLLLTTGFCGGFTTFSTFMNESSALMKDGSYTMMAVYLFGSLAIGFAAVLAGDFLSRLVN